MATAAAPVVAAATPIGKARKLPAPNSDFYQLVDVLTAEELAIVAFQDDRLAVLAIVISQVYVEGGASLDMLLIEAGSRMDPLKPKDHPPLASMRSARNGAAQPDNSAGDAITARERDVLSMIGQGHSNKRIARSLEISPETVKSHVKHIFSKLDVATRSEAVCRAASLGLL